MIGTDIEQEQLIEAYGGNPLALKMVAETIIDLFGGEIGLFLGLDRALREHHRPAQRANCPPLGSGTDGALLVGHYAGASTLR